ncbi:MAG: HTTM domain-containing protein [Bacteroidota bacterium]|nr:HTTM domain-containing protein [Bacteroidota bacterium]
MTESTENRGGFLFRQVGIAPLVVFRILFGVMMFSATLRFILKGWVYEQFVAPEHHLKYPFFEWVPDPTEWVIYLLFALLLISTLFIAIGFLYRIMAITYFLIFSYVELIDATYYLNHYYFISLVAGIMIFLPAGRAFSVDVRMGWVNPKSSVPSYSILSIKGLLALVYFYAGLAKLNPDWILEALPLRLWLPSQSHLPLVGKSLDHLWVAYAFSWLGALYDLSIPFLLSSKRTRKWAYLSVIIFHSLTAMLFQIGMFPWVMIVSTLIFFPEGFHRSILSRLGWKGEGDPFNVHRPSLIQISLILFFAFQILWPWRFLAYPGKLFWTEQGYRLGWRVMLMEKAGYITYRVVDPGTEAEMEVDPSEHLTPVQVKMLATQPDLILQYAHFIEQQMILNGVDSPQVYADVHVTLQGHGSRRFVDPNVDLSKEKEGFHHKTWVLPYE